MTLPSSSFVEPCLWEPVYNVHGDALGYHTKPHESYNGIENAFHQVDNYQTTIVSHQQISELQQIANSSYNMGCSFYQLGDYHNALDLHKKALTMRQKILGDCSMTADSHNEVGRAYYRLGDYHRAVESHKKCLEMRQKLLAQKHPALDSTYKLGSTDFDANHRQENPAKVQMHAGFVSTRLALLKRENDDVTEKNAIQIKKEEKTASGRAGGEYKRCF